MISSALAELATLRRQQGDDPQLVTLTLVGGTRLPSMSVRHYEDHTVTLEPPGTPLTDETEVARGTASHTRKRSGNYGRTLVPVSAIVALQVHD